MEAARALAEPKRREILWLVRDGERSAGEIAERFDITRPAVSQHLRVLKDSGLVTERRDGTRRLYGLRLEGLAELRDYLEELWGSRLTRLKHTIEGDLGRGPGRTGREAP